MGITHITADGVRAALAIARMSRDAFAELSGVSDGTIDRWRGIEEPVEVFDYPRVRGKAYRETVDKVLDALDALDVEPIVRDGKWVGAARRA